MQDKSDLLLKLLLKSGQAIALYSGEATLNELLSHPKFLQMRDEGNDVFISIEEIAAFEITNNRKEQQPQEADGKTKPESGISE